MNRIGMSVQTSPASGLTTSSGELTTTYRVLTAVSLCDLLNDMTQSILPSIYPILKDAFRLDFGQLGLLTFTFQLSASLLQPFIGLYTDKRPQPYSLPAGVTFSLAGILLLAFAPRFAFLM